MASRIPVDDIAKAVSGAVASVLSKINTNRNSDSDDDFRSRNAPVRKKKSTKTSAKPMVSAHDHKNESETTSDDDFEVTRNKKKKITINAKPTLPSTFLGKQRPGRKGTKVKKLFTYDRDIICLPKSYAVSSEIKIPKDRTELATNGLIGKIRLSSEMSEKTIFAEIRSVFREPMNNNELFQFDILQPMGGSSKSLTIPSLSESFKWTASAIISKNAKVPMYILAKEPLVKVISTSDEETDDSKIIDLTDNIASTNSKPAASRICISPKSEMNDRLLVFGDIYHGTDDWQYSPTPPIPSPLTPQPSSLDLPASELLSMHRSDILPIRRSDNTRITIRRKFVLQDTLHQFRIGLDIAKHLKVVFVGEPAVDDGGPLREYLYLLMKAVAQNNTLLAGPDDNRVPRHNVVELQKRTYFFIGVIFALSIIHGGPAPQFLSSAVADYIVYGPLHVKATAADIIVPEIKENVLKIENVESLSQLQELMDSDDLDFRYDLGISVSSAKISLADCPDITSAISFHYGILVVKAELDQILCGLSETLNVLDLIRKNPVVMRPMFVHQARPLLTADDVYDMIPPRFSVPGSNRREKEEATMMLWVEYLKLIENANGSVNVKSTMFAFTLEDIILFVTGMPYAPPMGFTPRPSVQFTIVSKFPTANTCANVLYLPLLHTTLEELSWHVCFGIQNSGGFGTV